MRLSLHFIPFLRLRQFASYGPSFPCVSKILCVHLWWAMCIIAGLCAVSVEVQAQNTSPLDIDVVLEPGHLFEEGWIITSPRFSSNLTYPMVIDPMGHQVFNELTPNQGFCFEHHPEGSLTWFSSLGGYWEVLDSSLQVTKTIGFDGANFKH